MTDMDHLEELAERDTILDSTPVGDEKKNWYVVHLFRLRE